MIIFKNRETVVGVFPITQGGHDLEDRRVYQFGKEEIQNGQRICLYGSSKSLNPEPLKMDYR
jgi:hypothetical protein